MAVLSFGRNVKINRLIDMFSAVFSNQFIHLKRMLWKDKTQSQLPLHFDSG